jgi:hypothetical protein
MLTPPETTIFAGAVSTAIEANLHSIVWVSYLKEQLHRSPEEQGPQAIVAGECVIQKKLFPVNNILHNL